MKAYDEDAKYILFINKSITILGCSTVNSLTIGFLGHIFQHIRLTLLAQSISSQAPGPSRPSARAGTSTYG